MSASLTNCHVEKQELMQHHKKMAMLHIQAQQASFAANHVEAWEHVRTKAVCDELEALDHLAWQELKAKSFVPRRRLAAVGLRATTP